MSTAISEPIDQTIRTVAVRRLGVVNATIIRHVDRGSMLNDAGVWFLLSVRLPGDHASKLIGRRRTKAELLSLVSTLDPRHVDGKCFRESRSKGRLIPGHQQSPEAAGVR
jgi:hypothetical protein